MCVCVCVYVCVCVRERERERERPDEREDDGVIDFLSPIYQSREGRKKSNETGFGGVN